MGPGYQEMASEGHSGFQLTVEEFGGEEGRQHAVDVLVCGLGEQDDLESVLIALELVPARQRFAAASVRHKEGEGDDPRRHDQRHLQQEASIVSGKRGMGGKEGEGLRRRKEATEGKERRRRSRGRGEEGGESVTS